MVKVYLILAVYLLFPILIVSAFHKWHFLQKIGTVILAYAVGVVMALTGVVAFEPDTAEAAAFTQMQNWLMNLSVPIAIPLMLFGCDFKLWTKSLPKTLFALLGGTVAVLVAVVSGFFVFRPAGIDDLANVSAMMTGIYTGGTMNFSALGTALHVDKTTMTLVLTFEMLVTFPLILFITAGGYKLFRKILPYPDEAVSVAVDAAHTEAAGVEDYRRMLDRHVFPKTLLGLLLSVAFLVMGAGLSLLITGTLNELVVILTITTLAIGASFFKKVRCLPKTFELGMIFILVFSIVVASQFDVYHLDMSALTLFYFVLYIMFVSVVVHLLFCRVGKVGGDLFTVAPVALLCSPPFVPPIVGAMGNKKVLISGIVIGLVGYAVGTYLGVAVAYLLQLF